VSRRELKEVSEMLVAVKGGGDLGTGVAHRLFMAGLRVVVLEKSTPTMLRRAVSFAEAVYSGSIIVEGVEARRVEGYEEALEAASARRFVPVLVDEQWGFIKWARPDVVVDAVMARRNLGTRIDEAFIVVALGPGFEAGRDVHAVVETKRGPEMGKVIYEGSAKPSDGVPEEAGGETWRRVARAPIDGVFQPLREIAEFVEEGNVLGVVSGVPIRSLVKGVVRGILHGGLWVQRGRKVAEVDPTGRRELCFTMSDRARAVAGGVLEAILRLRRLAKLA